jgi:hypothetical protein
MNEIEKAPRAASTQGVNDSKEQFKGNQNIVKYNSFDTDNLKEKTLAATNGGWDIYKPSIPNLHANGSKCANVKNPFYEDQKASLSVTKVDGF